MEHSILKARIMAVSSQLGFSAVGLSDTLKALGISDDDTGLKILDAPTTTLEDFGAALNQAAPGVSYPMPKVKLAWEILKGRDPFAPSFEEDLRELAKKAGATVDEMAQKAGVSLEEIRKLTKQSALGLFQRAAAGLHKAGDSATELVSALSQVIPKPIGQWSDTVLLQAYGKDCMLDVERELRERTSGRPCIIFKDDGAVDVENSFTLVRLARRNSDMPETYPVPDPHTAPNAQVIKVVYRVGEFPADVMFECPIHSETLLINGYCDKCGKKWNPAEDYSRSTLLRLVMDTEHPADMRMYRDKTFAELQGYFPRAYQHWQNLFEEGRLPSLKRRIAKAKSGDPFHVSHVRH